MVKCDDKFPFVSQSLYEENNIKEYYCPENKDYYIASNINSPNFQSLTVIVSEWNSTKHSNWKSPSEIEIFIRNHVVDLKIIYSYFDFENFENPIKTYLGDYDVSIFENSILSVQIYFLINFRNVLPNLKWQCSLFLKKTIEVYFIYFKINFIIIELTFRHRLTL